MLSTLLKFKKKNNGLNGIFFEIFQVDSSVQNILVMFSEIFLNFFWKSLNFFGNLWNFQNFFEFFGIFFEKKAEKQASKNSKKRFKELKQS